MKYFIHDSDTGRATEVPRDAMRAILGAPMFQRLLDTGSLTSGTSVYEARPDSKPSACPMCGKPITP